MALCLFGGVVAASFLFIVATVLSFDLRDQEGASRVIVQWTPSVWFIGAAFGAAVVYRSQRKKLLQRMRENA
jgi:hypothetical protein